MNARGCVAARLMRIKDQSIIANGTGRVSTTGG